MSLNSEKASTDPMCITSVRQMRDRIVVVQGWQKSMADLMILISAEIYFTLGMLKDSKLSA